MIVPKRGIGRLSRALLAASLGLALAGCAGEGSGLLTGQMTAAPAAEGPAGAALVTGATPDKSAFDPFAQPGTTSTPLREVIQNPTRAQVMAPGPLPEFTLGRPDAPVTIVKYMSLTCPYCKRFMAETFPVLKRELIDTGKVRLVLREFPIGKTSGTATIALRCAPMSKYLTLYQKFLEQQHTWVSQEVRPDAIFAVARQVGLTRPEFDACMADKKLEDALKAVKDRGRSLGIIGTPNFYVETRLVKKVVGMDELRDMVRAAGG